MIPHHSSSDLGLHVCRSCCCPREYWIAVKHSAQVQLLHLRFSVAASRTKLTLTLCLSPGVAARQRQATGSKLDLPRVIESRRESVARNKQGMFVAIKNTLNFPRLTYNKETGK
jgi:hypothetical protein